MKISRLHFFGNPILDMVLRGPGPVGTEPLQRHLPLEKLLNLEKKARSIPDSLAFYGPSGGAFSAAAAAARLFPQVTAWGSAGKDAPLFFRAAAENGFSFIDPVGSSKDGGRFISSIPDLWGPYAAPGAAALFLPEHIPVFLPEEIPFFEAFLLSRFPTSFTLDTLRFEGEPVLAIDLSSPFCSDIIRKQLIHISRDAVLILFATIEESRSFFCNKEDLHGAIADFCDRENWFLLKGGDTGAWLFRPGGKAEKPFFIPPLPVKEVHAVNCGDVFAGTFLGALASGILPEEAAVKAAEEGAKAAATIGNMLVSPS